MTAQDLIARLEKATGPDRGLDADIHEVIGRGRASVILEHWPPHYTASIDAALTLVPEGHGVLMATGRFCKATVSVGYLGDMDAKWTGDANALTLPLALCIAALRARATGTQP